MTENPAYVIVGAGLAGAKAAEALREEGFSGPVILIGDETERPYERPALSKDYLMGKAERESLYVHPEGWYAEHDVDLRLGVTVTGIERPAHEVLLEDGSRAGYSRLLLTTGSHPAACRCREPTLTASSTCAGSGTVTGSGRPSRRRSASS